MTRNDVIETIRSFISKQFPKQCPCCSIEYLSLADYLHNTTHIGKPVSYDANEDNWKPLEPLGTMSAARCSCGTTLVISSKGMNILTLWRLMRWAKKETKRLKIDISDLLAQIREEIDRRTFQEESSL